MFNIIRQLFAKNATNITVVENETTELDPVKYPTMVLLHGANQTSNSFGYIRSKLPANVNVKLIDYSCYFTFEQNIQDMTEQLKSAGPLFVVGHSLGGVYAMHLIKHVNVVGGVTLSTPYQGSSMADWAKYLVPGYPLLKDIGKRSKPITEMHNIKVNIPWAQLVSVSGHVPWMNEPNDGVLTLDSMRAKAGIEYIDVDTNHYEIMCNDIAIDIILDRYYTHAYK